MTDDLIYRDVEIRTWPERTDVLVIDVQTTRVLAEYAIADPDDPLSGEGPLFDPRTPFEERSRLAIEAVEDDQEYLRAVFDRNGSVCLRPAVGSRKRQAELLLSVGLSLEEIELSRLNEAGLRLQEIGLEELYRLLCDWHDIVERHYPGGSSLSDPSSWVHRANPDACTHFHNLAGVEHDSDELGDEAAYRLFRELIDVSLPDFSFGLFLRHIYFHRTEFADRQPFVLRALADAGVH